MFQRGIIITFLCTFLFTTFHLPALPVLPDPDPATIPTQSLHLPPPSPLPTIPAFPEQSEASGCPLDLPDDLFHGIKTACGSKPDPNSQSGHLLHRTRCCPVLAAYLYSAYSKTALHSTTILPKKPKPHSTTTPYNYDMPVLPDDSETCVDTLEKALSNRGVELNKPNATCDVVYCYCGIRLRQFTCPQAFSVDSRGKLIGNSAVKKLEHDCVNGCSNCLNTLQLLNKGEVKSNNSDDADRRKGKMRNRDCELIGLTWLLNKDRSGYIHSVSAVLRAIMMSKNDDVSVPEEYCRLNSDGMPLAVDSSEIDDDQSSSTILAITFQQYYYLMYHLVSILFLVGLDRW